MVQDQIEKWNTTLVGQTLLFSLLGRILLEEPNRDWLETLIREDVFSEAPFGAEQADVQRGLASLQAWAGKNPNGISKENFESIQHDHLYLFTGVGKPLAPVWESIYFSEAGLLFQVQTLQVREWYARYGLQFENLHHQPDDHIGLELGFIAHLSGLALRMLEGNDQTAFQCTLQAERDFLKEHLLRWAPLWSELVQQHARTDFYRGIAWLVSGALQKTSDMVKAISVTQPAGEVSG